MTIGSSYLPKSQYFFSQKQFENVSEYLGEKKHTLSMHSQLYRTKYPGLQIQFKSKLQNLELEE